ncbi:MAG: hypothetical protein IJH53_05690 [Oscillospiraceae bacterium]|nr:hypothetical protein [Oscillospiraceae bacterium]
MYHKTEQGAITGWCGPIDPEKTYTLAWPNYWLPDCGDGFSIFDGANITQDRVELDNHLLIDYITESLGGIIGEEYEDPLTVRAAS